MARAKNAARKKTRVAVKLPAKQPGTQQYEKRLLKVRENLMKQVAAKQNSSLPDMEVGDEADAATQSAERELLFELSDSERQQLDAIEAALRKIEQRRFGQCESCQKKIAGVRLRAMPQARYCIHCQGRFEAPRH